MGVRAQTSRELTEVLDGVLSDPTRLARMSMNAKRLAKPHAAEAVAEILERLVPQRRGELLLP